MEDSYTKYVENLKLGFDSWPEIEENLTLQQILNVIIHCSYLLKLWKVKIIFIL